MELDSSLMMIINLLLLMLSSNDGAGCLIDPVDTPGAK